MTNDLSSPNYGITTATVEAVNDPREYLGGAIVPELRTSMNALEKVTASLPEVEILRPEAVCGRLEGV